MPHTSDAELIQHTHNTARYFVEHRQIAWAALLGVLGWGVFGYFSMPQRKDPEIPVRVAVAACQWPGATAQQVEQLVTRPIEETIAQNKTIHPAGPDDYGIRSISLPGASFVYVQLSEDTKNSREQFSDINLKLQGLGPKLPSGATGVQFQSDFGDTAALMMTVASSSMNDLEIERRERSIEEAIRAARAAASHSKLQPVSIIYTFPLSLYETAMIKATEEFRRSAERDGMIGGGKLVAGRGFLGIDGVTTYDDKDLAAYLERYIASNFHESEFDPDISARVIIRELDQTREKFTAAAGLKYSYAQLDDFTDLISRSLLGVAQTSRIERRGVLPQAVYLEYSQERPASYGMQVADLGRVLLARNITLPGGSIEAGGREIQIDPLRPV
jgi:multidrug efflux pump subunit AcrB